jgi:hypothetical protein
MMQFYECEEALAGGLGAPQEARRLHAPLVFGEPLSFFTLPNDNQYS